MSEKACRNCHTLTVGSICPNCKTATLSDDWTGIAIILDSEESQIAKKLNLKKPGRYALKVR
ncbi:DNA-directed RNA polymerase, subunit E'' [Candidatus Bathyarchaeota archaeon]|nr:DNA-directed RNA polymerase, subunit E'' [Candidatus Bathyarchaeota archaeon]